MEAVGVEEIEGDPSAELETLDLLDLFELSLVRSLGIVKFDAELFDPRFRCPFRFLGGFNSLECAPENLVLLDGNTSFDLDFDFDLDLESERLFCFLWPWTPMRDWDLPFDLEALFRLTLSTCFEEILLRAEGDRAIECTLCADNSLPVSRRLLYSAARRFFELFFFDVPVDASLMCLIQSVQLLTVNGFSEWIQ